MLRAGGALGLAAMLPAARACEYFTTNLRITHPWTRATAPDARSAVLCMTIDSVVRADRLLAVRTPVATGFEWAGIGAARELVFAPESATVLSEQGPHLRLLGLVAPLETARSYPLQLHFEHGGVVDALLNVDYARFF
jgi:copper(I)-binding protein